MSFQTLRTCTICVLALTLAIQGCGGASGGASGSGGRVTGSTGGTGGGSGVPVGGSSSAAIAATFQVDVNTGNVTVVSAAGAPSGSSRAKPSMFTGNSIGFNSTTLTNLSLSTGAKVMSVALVNNSGSTIGVDATGNVSGMNVIFGAFANTTGIHSETANTRVSTFAGTSTAGFEDGATSVAKLNSTAGVAVGANGSVYVGDYGNNRIRKVNSGFVSTLAGTGVAAELDGPATKAEFDGPYGVAVNPVDGSIIVADYAGDTVRRVTAAGVVNTVAGTALTAGSTNGAGNAALLANPAEVAVDSLGNIYVAESTSNRIRKIALTGSNPSLSSNYTVTTFAGSGTAGLLDGNGVAAEFFRPYGLAADPNNNLYVADYNNNVIRMIDPSANVTTIAGTGVQSDLDAYGNAATFNHPFGVAYQNGALYVSEFGGNRVREVMQIPGGGNTSASWVAETLAGTGTVGDFNSTGNASTFKTPESIAASSASSLYVADYGNSQIRKVSPSTGTFPIGTPTGTTNTTGDEVTLSNPSGIEDDSDLGPANFITYPGSLAQGQTSAAQPWNFIVPSGVTSFQFQVILESNTSELISLQSAFGAGSPLVDIRTFAGSGATQGFVDGSASEARFQNQLGLAYDGNGVLYVADRYNEAIRRIDPAGNVSTIAGTLNSGGIGSTNGLGTVAQFSDPSGIAVNSSGTEIFVAEADGDTIREMELTPGTDPTNPADWTVSLIAGTYATAGTTDGNGSTALLTSPEGITIGPTGNLYVTELGPSFAGDVMRITYTGGPRSSPLSWNLQRIAGGNTQGYANGLGGAAEFDSPYGICCDPFGNLYVADSQNYAIRKIDPDGNVTTFAGPNAPTFSAGYVDGVAFTARFNAPFGLTMDSAGYLYVAEYTNSLVRRISPTGYVTTVAGKQGVLGEADGPGNTATFTEPYGIVATPSGSLYVSDNQDAVRLIQTVVSSAAGKARN